MEFDVIVVYKSLLRQLATRFTLNTKSSGIALMMVVIGEGFAVRQGYDLCIGDVLTRRTLGNRKERVC